MRKYWIVQLHMELILLLNDHLSLSENTAFDVCQNHFPTIGNDWFTKKKYVSNRFITIQTP